MSTSANFSDAMSLNQNSVSSTNSGAAGGLGDFIGANQNSVNSQTSAKQFQLVLKKEDGQNGARKLYANQKSLGAAHIPVVIQSKGLRFVITDSSTDSNIDLHVQQLVKLKVRHVVRTTEPTYSIDPFLKAGIKVHEMWFKDGDPPPDDVLLTWLKFVAQCFEVGDNQKSKSKNKNRSPQLVNEITPLQEDEKIAVHCVAGLGRAPVLVAVALVEYCGLSANEAINIIRTQRRGAINQKQAKWLEGYVPKSKKQKASSVDSSSRVYVQCFSKCTVS